MHISCVISCIVYTSVSPFFSAHSWYTCMFGLIFTYRDWQYTQCSTQYITAYTLSQSSRYILWGYLTKQEVSLITSKLHIQHNWTYSICMKCVYRQSIDEVLHANSCISITTLVFLLWRWRHLLDIAQLVAALVPYPFPFLFTSGSLPGRVSCKHNILPSREPLLAILAPPSSFSMAKYAISKALLHTTTEIWQSNAAFECHTLL